MTLDDPTRPSAFDCLSRGLATLRANWQLVPLVWLQQWLVTFLTLASIVVFFVPLIATSGLVDSLEGLRGMPAEALADELIYLLGGIAREDLAALALALVLGAIPSTLVGLAAMFVFAWFTAGTFGVLVAAERQAPAGATDHRLFRTYQWRAFSTWGGRWMWRYFWFVNLFFVLALLLLLFATLIVAIAVWVGESAGVGAGVAVGCAGALPLVFAYLVLCAWYFVGLSDLAREPVGDEREGIRATSRRAMEVLSGRWGAFLVLGLLYVGATLAMSVGMTPVNFLGPGLVESNPFAYCGLQLLAYTLQTLAGSVIYVPFFGALVALTWSQVRRPRPGRETAGETA